MIKNIHLLKNLYTEDRICPKKSWARLEQQCFLRISGCICDGPVAIPVCLVCWCALLPFCAAPYGIKGFPPVRDSPSPPCCGCFSCVCRYCAEIFLFRVILDPLDTAGAANKEKFSRGSAKANEFEIGIQHMGTTQKVLYTLINLSFLGKTKFLCQ